MTVFRSWFHFHRLSRTEWQPDDDRDDHLTVSRQESYPRPGLYRLRAVSGNRRISEFQKLSWVFQPHRKWQVWQPDDDRDGRLKVSRRESHRAQVLFLRQGLLRLRVSCRERQESHRVQVSYREQQELRRAQVLCRERQESHRVQVSYRERQESRRAQVSHREQQVSHREQQELRRAQVSYRERQELRRAQVSHREQQVLRRARE